MKTLILAGFVALISFQASAASSSTCPFRKNGGLIASASHDSELPNAPVVKPQVQQVVKPAVRAAGTNGTNL
jgi:hypothetical protein